VVKVVRLVQEIGHRESASSSWKELVGLHSHRLDLLERGLPKSGGS
jgi:hypothetical protein